MSLLWREIWADAASHSWEARNAAKFAATFIQSTSQNPHRRCGFSAGLRRENPLYEHTFRAPPYALHQSPLPWLNNLLLPRQVWKKSRGIMIDIKLCHFYFAFLFIYVERLLYLFWDEWKVLCLKTKKNFRIQIYRLQLLEFLWQPLKTGWIFFLSLSVLFCRSEFSFQEVAGGVYLAFQIERALISWFCHFSNYIALFHCS